MKPKLMAIKIQIFLFVIFGTLIFWGCQFIERSAEPTVYKNYLPIIVIPTRSALRGAALTGPYSAVGQLGARWYYNWSWKQPPSAPLQDPLFVPMIWGRSSMTNLSEIVAIAMAGSGWILGFNEPDYGPPWGCNIDPIEGAVFWHEIEQAAQGVRLVSPAPSQIDFDWLWHMVDEYERRYGRKPRFNAIAVHYYTGYPPDIEGAKQHLLLVRQEALARGYNVPIWLTEFAGACGVSGPENGNRRLMEELIPWMKQQSWIARYAWFATHLTGDQVWCLGCQPCSLTDPDTGQQLTSLGELYRRIDE
jgi:hypothetical protein